MTAVSQEWLSIWFLMDLPGKTRTYDLMVRSNVPRGLTSLIKSLYCAPSLSYRQYVCLLTVAHSYSISTFDGPPMGHRKALK